MNREQELKPCPFCGSANLKSGGDDKHVGYWCSECGAVGPNHYDRRYDWNRRAALEPAPKVQPLDLSNLLRHAFSCGYNSAAGEGGWEDYDPTACQAHHRILSALSAPKAEDLALGMDHVGKSLEASVKPEIDRLAGSIAPEAEAVSWDGMQSAPKDGSIVRLLVVPDPEAWTPFDDSHNPYETIGFNNLANTQEDRWEFAGWDWNQDCFITGQGEVIGWLPFHTSPVPTITDEAVERAAKAIHDGPLGANDEEDFGDNKASDWCREVARAALLAAFPSKGDE